MERQALSGNVEDQKRRKTCCVHKKCRHRASIPNPIKCRAFSLREGSRDFAIDLNLNILKRSVLFFYCSYV